MFSAVWFICKDLFRLLTHSTNIWPRVSAVVLCLFFLFTFFIMFIFFVALRCRLLHLASRASITRGSLTTTTGPGMLQCCDAALAPPNALFAPYTTCCHALYGTSFAQPQALLPPLLFATATACPVKVNNANATRCDPLRFVSMRCLSELNNLQSRLSMSANHRNSRA